MDTQSIVAELTQERDRIQQAINALEGIGGKTRKPGRQTGRHMSPDARRRIGLAMKKTWAKRKEAAKKAA